MSQDPLYSIKCDVCPSIYLYAYEVSYMMYLPVLGESKQGCKEATSQHAYGQIVTEIHPLSNVTTVIQNIYNRSAM